MAAAGERARALRSRGVYGPGGGARGSGGHRHRWKRTAPIAGHAGALAAMGEVFFLKSPLGLSRTWTMYSDAPRDRVGGICGTAQAYW